jgi:hypothetical protein
LLAASTGRLTVGTATSPGTTSTTGAPVEVRFGCGSALNQRRYRQVDAAAVLGPGTFFESDASILDNSCDQMHGIAEIRTGVAAFGGLVLLLAAGVWPRRRAIRALVVGSGAICGLAAFLVPINGTLRWW